MPGRRHVGSRTVQSDRKPGEGFEAFTRLRDQLSLTVLAGAQPGAPYFLRGEVLLLGRAADCGARIDDPEVSTHHARIVRAAGCFYVQDLGSRNGTFVEQKRVNRRRDLRDGDRIQVGATLLRVTIHDAAEQELTRVMYELATRDHLTGVPNRRYLDESLHGELAFANRHKTPLSVLLLDIDHFKNVNDTHGHLAGDEVIRNVAHHLRTSIRIEDALSRYGGEEFCVIARATDAQGAAALAGRLIAGAARIEHRWQDKTIKTTISVGIATRSEECPHATAATLLAAADAALLRAKREGRNRYCVDDPAARRAG